MTNYLPTTNIFAKARLQEVIEHLCYYQHLCIFSNDGFQIPCLRKYAERYHTLKDKNDEHSL